MNLKHQMRLAGLEDDVEPAGVAAQPERPDRASSGPSTTMRRAIPKDFDYDPQALKPLARMLWTLSISLGHAMSAHREFTKLKSATISPDGLIGGRGYVMSVKDVRGALHDACEAISSVSDTIHDELHAPHWRPKLGELESQDVEGVERLVGDAERVLENPEDESFVEDGLNKAEESGEQAELEEGEVNNPESDQRFHPPPPPASMKKKDDDEEDEDEEDEDEDEEGAGVPDARDMPDSESAKVKTASWVDPMIARIANRFANSSIPVETMSGGPRVQHMDRADTDQTGPFGSYNQDEPPSMKDEWSREDGAGKDYLYESEWENALPDKSAAWPSLTDYDYDPRMNVDAPDMNTIRGIVDLLKKGRPPAQILNTHGARKYKLTKKDLDGFMLMDQRGLLKSADSRMPGRYTDNTPTEGWDFGIGYGDGDDAHGQGAGGYGEKDPDGKGVFGPSSKLPSDPGGKLHDDESDTTPSIEMEMGRSNRQAHRGQSHLPNDGQPPVARSDYYRSGDKGSNPVNVGPSNVGSSKMPDQAFPGQPRPVTPRPAHYREHMFADSELPSEPDASYDHSMDVQPGIGYRHEQNQPYVKWDYSTRNMRPDPLSQRDDDGPYINQKDGER
jgi:hypothetical protein